MTITVSQLSKRFQLYRRPWHRFKEWASLGRIQCHQEYWALRNVDLTVREGAAMGIIGANGAGKSTLLKIITGTLFPTEGKVEVEGRVAGLLELGTGFHPEFTGRMNIYLNGKMLGLSDGEIEERFDDIVRFSELGDFIEQPIRTYSSGMAMRLGFSIASCVDPDVLIIDEVLSVGDAYFSQKCVRRIKEFREKGVTILFVSHDPNAVLSLCDQAILLERGEVLFSGSPEETLDYYNARISQHSSEASGRILVGRDRGEGFLGAQRSGNFRALFSAVEMINRKGELSDWFTVGEAVSLKLGVTFLETVKNPTIGILFRNRLGIPVYGVNTKGLKMELGHFEAGETLTLEWNFPLNLGPDDYSLTVAAHLDEKHLGSNFDWIDKACQFRVVGGADCPFYGLARLEPTPREMERGRIAPSDLAQQVEVVLGEPPFQLGPGPEDDLFFLEGFASVHRDKVKGRRVEGEMGRFFFRSHSGTITLRFSELPKATQMGLSVLGSPLNIMSQSEDRLVFALPESLWHQSLVFAITVPEANRAGLVLTVIEDGKGET